MNTTKNLIEQQKQDLLVFKSKYIDLIGGCNGEGIVGTF